LALFGLPLSEPTPEVNSSGENVVTQWFERARFEFHPDKPQVYQVLLGLLGNETARPGGSTTPPSGQTPASRCLATPPLVDATIKPSGCVVTGTLITIGAFGFTSGEEISFYVATTDGQTFEQDPFEADDQGRLDLLLSTGGLPNGIYGLVFQGTQSDHQSVVYVQIVDR
jgi:hypothetical protein